MILLPPLCPTPLPRVVVAGRWFLAISYLRKEHTKLAKQECLAERGCVFLFTVIILNFDGLLLTSAK